MTLAARRRLAFYALTTVAALWLLALGYAVLKAFDVAILTAWSAER